MSLNMGCVTLCGACVPVNSLSRAGLGLIQCCWGFLRVTQFGSAPRKRWRVDSPPRPSLILQLLLVSPAVHSLPVAVLYTGLPFGPRPFWNPFVKLETGLSLLPFAGVCCAAESSRRSGLCALPPLPAPLSNPVLSL